jgi:hypothetical protein
MQAITLVAQAWITILLALLGFIVQAIAADQITCRHEGRRKYCLIAEDDLLRPLGQTVAALQDRLDSWKGLGPSLMSLWRSRLLEPRLGLRVLTATAFLQELPFCRFSTPSVILEVACQTGVPVS